MKQFAGSYNQPFTLRPFQIWNGLDVRQKTALTIIYQLDNDSECLEHQRLKTEGSCRPSDDWRWMPFTALCAQETTRLRDRLLEAGIGEREALDLLRALEMRGLIRCQQDRWAQDNRLFVRILFLGQRVVRDGQS
jgi:hypothetical protein